KGDSNLGRREVQPGSKQKATISLPVTPFYGRFPGSVPAELTDQPSQNRRGIKTIPALLGAPSHQPTAAKSKNRLAPDDAQNIVFECANTTEELLLRLRKREVGSSLLKTPDSSTNTLKVRFFIISRHITKVTGEPVT
ncbi:MAG: hypothetical protein KBT68_06375, partial [bacterium]|nr:hypothetical protein [Candidatus Colisoma equi]